MNIGTAVPVKYQAKKKKKKVYSFIYLFIFINFDRAQYTWDMSKKRQVPIGQKRRGKKKEKNFTPGKVPIVDRPSWFKSPNFSFTRLVFTFYSLTAVLYSELVPLPLALC